MVVAPAQPRAPRAWPRCKSRNGTEQRAPAAVWAAVGRPGCHKSMRDAWLVRTPCRGARAADTPVPGGQKPDRGQGRRQHNKHKHKCAALKRRRPQKTPSDSGELGLHGRALMMMSELAPDCWLTLLAGLEDDGPVVVPGAAPAEAE